MIHSTRAVVHSMIAPHAQLARVPVDDARTVEELGLEPLDLIVIVLQLEALGELRCEPALERLGDVRTVGAFVALVDAWRTRSTIAAAHECRDECGQARQGRAPERAADPPRDTERPPARGRGARVYDRSALGPGRPAAGPTDNRPEGGAR